MQGRHSLPSPHPHPKPPLLHPTQGWVGWEWGFTDTVPDSPFVVNLNWHFLTPCIMCTAYWITFSLICERDIFSGIIPQFRGLQMNVHAFVMYKLSSCFVNWRASETRVWCTDEFCAVLKNHLPSLWLGGTVGFWYQYPMLHRTSITSSNCSEL